MKLGPISISTRTRSERYQLFAWIGIPLLILGYSALMGFIPSEGWSLSIFLGFSAFLFTICGIMLVVRKALTWCDKGERE